MWWQCKLCEAENETLVEAREHAETHVEGLKFPCRLCGTVFTGSRDMKQHRQSCYKKQLIA